MAANRSYVMNFSAVANPAADKPFLQIVPAAGIPITITELHIFQSTPAAASAMAGFYWCRTSTASTGGSAAAVAAKDGTAQTAMTGVIAPTSEMDPLTSVQLGTALTCTSIGASTMTRGTVVAPLHIMGFNLASGWYLSPIPRNPIGVKGGGFICLQALATLTVTIAGFVVFEEAC